MDARERERERTTFATGRQKTRCFSETLAVSFHFATIHLDLLLQILILRNWKPSPLIHFDLTSTRQADRTTYPSTLIGARPSQKIQCPSPSSNSYACPRPPQSYSSLGLISTPIVLFLALFVAKITWAVVIYPKFFSPLRHLPTPDDNAFFSGQTKRVFREAGGRPMRHWIETVKNDGLIAYSVWFRERVLVTDPKTLGEVLVTKVGFLC
jgi:hypothetical protein